MVPLSIHLRCSWCDYYRAQLAKMRATPYVATHRATILISAIIAVSIARPTKLRGIATFAFDDEGISRTQRGKVRGRVLWSDLLRCERSERMLWLYGTSGAMLLPLRMLSPLCVAEIVAQIALRGHTIAPLSPLEDEVLRRRLG